MLRDRQRDTDAPLANPAMCSHSKDKSDGCLPPVWLRSWPKCVTCGAAASVHNSQFAFRICHLPFRIFISSFLPFIISYLCSGRGLSTWQVTQLAGVAAGGRPKMVANCFGFVLQHGKSNCDLWRRQHQHHHNRRVAIADRK